MHEFMHSKWNQKPGNPDSLYGTLTVSMVTLTVSKGSLTVSMEPLQSLWNPESLYGNPYSLYETLKVSKGP